MKLSVEGNENYAAQYVRLTEFAEIPGANTIKHAIIHGNRVIVAKEVTYGDFGIFFPVESQIAKDFLSFNNQFSHKEANKDQEKVGYFEEKGRVRCVRFMKVPSEGFFCPLNYLTHWKGIATKNWELVRLDTKFDHINGYKLCNKYIIRVPQVQGVRVGRKVKKQPSRMIEGVYKLHYDTPKLMDNIHLLTPEDKIFITNKLHGTSFSMGRVKVKRKLSLLEKIKNFFKFPVVLTEYDDIYASRSVIKNATATQKNNDWYGEDVWKNTFEELKHLLVDGMQFYGEIVGFTPSGGGIQKGWDYGCAPKEAKSYLYRITSTDEEGVVREWDMSEVISYCKENNLNHVPVYYQGLARDLFPDLDLTNHWHRDFTERLRNSFNMEKNCELCKNKVPAEGIALRIEGRPLPAYKFKAFLFLKKETEMLDKGEVDMESAEASEAEVVI